MTKWLLERDGLRVLTKATGGRALQTSDLAVAISQIESDARFQYALAYTPAGKQDTRRLHNVCVICERKGVHLQTQEVYPSEARP